MNEGQDHTNIEAASSLHSCFSSMNLFICGSSNVNLGRFNSLTPDKEILNGTLPDGLLPTSAFFDRLP